MAKSIHLGFRAHIHEDRDIIEDLQRFTDKTARLKEVYRRVMAMEAMTFQAPPPPVEVKASEDVPAAPALPAAQAVEAIPSWQFPQKPNTEKTMDWRPAFEENTAVSPPQKTSNGNGSAVVANILNSFD